MFRTCENYLKEKYKLNYIQSINLMVGSRGFLIKLFLDFICEFKLPSKLRDDVFIILKLSNQIIQTRPYHKNMRN